MPTKKGNVRGNAFMKYATSKVFGLVRMAVKEIRWRNQNRIEVYLDAIVGITNPVIGAIPMHLRLKGREAPGPDLILKMHTENSV